MLVILHRQNLIFHNGGFYTMTDYAIKVSISFFIYLSILVAIGYFFYKKTTTISEYMLGERQLNGWVTSLSAQASDMSGWLLLGLPGYAYLAGYEASWIAIGLAAGTYLNWKFVAKRLRQYTQISNNSLTLSDFFENRFRDKSKMLRIVSAIFILVFFIFYTSSGLVAGGKLFNSIFGISYLSALTIGAVCVVSYTFLGGFLAVCWTDLFQGMLMFFTILIVPFIGFKKMGGIENTFDTVKGINSELLTFFTGMDGIPLGTMALVSLLAWGLGYFGQPHILVRFMATKSSSEIKKARIIAMVWVLLSLTGAIFVGIVGRAYLGETLMDGTHETVFMLLVHDLFYPLVAGFLLAAVLSAIMSTADSQLLVAASAVTEDFYRTLFKKDATDKELLMVSRLSVVIIAIIAYIIALNPNSSVLDLVAYAWAGFGAAFGPIVLFSLFWKRMTRNGALAGMISGGLTVILWKNLSGGIFDLYEIVPGFFISCILIIIFSLIDKEPSQEIQDEFESVLSSKI